MFPHTQTFWHRLNPLTRFIFIFSMVLLAFILPEAGFSMGLFLLFILPLAVVVKAAGPMLLVIIKFLLPFCLFLFPVHGLLVPGQNAVLFKGIAVNPAGIAEASLICARIMVMLGSFYLLFRTTHPGLLMKELVHRGLPWGPAYVITATLQLLPRMQERAAVIKQSQQARGLDPAGNIFVRGKALLPLIGPLIFGALGEVEDRALALELRNFGHNGRKTRMLPAEDSRVQFWFRCFCLGTVFAAGGIRLCLL